MVCLTIIRIRINIFSNIFQIRVDGLEKDQYLIIHMGSDFNMRFLLDIVIPKDEMEKVELKEQLIEWGGDIFSQEPAKYIGRENLVFEELTNLNYYNRLLGYSIDAKKYSALIFKGEELSELEYLVNSKSEDMRNNPLFVFLERLITVSSFYIFLLREDEVIKERYLIESGDEFRKVLCESLSWNTPKDILIFKK